MRLIKRLIAVAILLAVLAFGVLFSIQNTSPAPLDLLFVQLPEQRVALWVLLAFTAGGVLGVVVSLFAIAHLKSQHLSLRRKLDRSEKELDKLRTGAIKS